MNRENLRRVRERIASEPPENFLMAEWRCGTAFCIGGWAQVIAEAETSKPMYVSDIREWLGLTEEQEDSLFFGRGAEIELGEMTRADALAALDSLIEAEDDDAHPVWPGR